jgi:energy-converting hydrogenase Eha subunit B
MKTVSFFHGIGRFCFFFAVLFGIAFNAAAQNNKMGKIAILTFNGGTPDERDGIPEMISFTSAIMDNFLVIPRTTIAQAVSREQSFQSTSGMTDADTIARLGNQFGADFVMAGSIAPFGTSNLLLVSVIKIDVIQQVAGYIVPYNSLDALNRDKSIVSRMAGFIVETMKKETTGLDKLSVLPVQFADGVNAQEGDALAQILSIYLIHYGKYAVYPRTKTLEQVQGEYKTQLSGVTRDDQTVALGRGINPPFVLSVASRRIGSSNRFNASIIDLEGGHQIAGLTEPYESLIDGMDAMDFLARELSGIKVSERERSRRQSTFKADERKDKFLEDLGVNFSGWYGFASSSLKSPEGKGTNDLIIRNDYNNDATDGGANIELRLSNFFGIGTGIGLSKVTYDVFTTNDKGIETTLGDLEHFTVQLPFFVRVNLMIGDDVAVSLSPYIGIGVNLLSKLTSTYGSIETELLTASKCSFIAGGEFGLWLHNFNVFLGMQYNEDFGYSALRVNGKDFSYKRGTVGVTFGIGFFVPFR